MVWLKKVVFYYYAELGVSCEVNTFLLTLKVWNIDVNIGAHIYILLHL
jgi:hypothetical protein